MRFQCFEKFDGLFFLDAAIVQPEYAVGAGKPGNHQDVVPVEMNPIDGHLPLGRPSANARGAFADSGLIHKDNQTAFSLRFSLRAGNVLRFQLCTVSSLRSIAR